MTKEYDFNKTPNKVEPFNRITDIVTEEDSKNNDSVFEDPSRNKTFGNGNNTKTMDDGTVES
jgi:hypothetical protein